MARVSHAACLPDTPRPVGQQPSPSTTARQAPLPEGISNHVGLSPLSERGGAQQRGVRLIPTANSAKSREVVSLSSPRIALMLTDRGLVYPVLIRDIRGKRVGRDDKIGVDFAGVTAFFRPLSRPGGGIGRRSGLKIHRPLKSCGFDPHPGHQSRNWTAFDNVRQSETIVLRFNNFGDGILLC